MTLPPQAWWNGLAGLLALAAAWGWTWRHLALEWRLNDQYSFGYLVPWLGGWLLWLRLTALPRPAGPPRPAWPGRLLLAFAGMLFALGELVRQSDPTWRLAGWLMFGGALLLTAGWLQETAGPSHLRALAGPLAFQTLALPWPSLLELKFTGALLRWTTACTVDWLNWTGHPAVQRGNVIEVSTGAVGVDLACSGIQSLQASIMAALFLGELSRHGWRRRVMLVVGGVGGAVLLNAGRVYALARVAAASGTEALGQKHDTFGLTATALIFTGLFLLDRWLLRGRASAPPEVPGRWAEWLVPRPGVQGWVALAAAVGLALLAAGAAGWQRNFSDQDPAQPQWQPDARRLPPAWLAQARPFTDIEQRLLRFSFGTKLDVVTPGGREAHVVHCFWRADAQIPNQAFSHSPDICMPSNGWQPVAPPQPMTLTVNGSPLPGRLHRFQLLHARVVVFQAVALGGVVEPATAAGPLATSRWQRLALMWQGGGPQTRESITVFLPAGIAEEGRSAAELGAVLDALLAPGPAH